MTIKNFKFFINEGAREESEINRLLDIMSRRELTSEEKKLLSDLSSGVKKLDDDKPILKKHKTGGLLFDSDGGVLTEGDPGEGEAGQEFVTNKGKTRNVEKEDVEEITNARVYRNMDSEERFYYIYTRDKWIIYRTGGKLEYGMFLDETSNYYKKYLYTKPDAMWKELDFVYEVGMELDRKTLDMFSTFLELYNEDQKKNSAMLQQLHAKLKILI